jgi:hypothetical protein
MHRWWQHLARAADNIACSSEELRDLLEDAATRTLKKSMQGIMDAVLKIVLAGDTDLFPDFDRAIDQLRSKTADPNCQVFLDALEYECRNANYQLAIKQAVAQTADEVARRHCRLIEEHFRRQSTQSRSDQVRFRLEGARRSADFSQFKIDRKSGRIQYPNRSLRNSGMDDGVAL